MFEFLEEENILLEHPSLINSRFSHRSLIVQGVLYALGGYDKENHLFMNTCEAYDLKESWLTYKQKPNQSFIVSTISKLETDNKWREIAPMLHKWARFGACAFRNTSIYVFCGISFVEGRENDQKSVSLELNSIEKYDIANDVWTEIVLSRGSLTPCHNLGSVSCYGLHCQEEGMIIFGGEYVTAESEDPIIIQDVFLFSPDNKRVKNIGKNSKVRYGPKLQDNTRYQ